MVKALSIAVMSAFLVINPAYAGLICNFDSYEQSENFFEMMHHARKSYDAGIGLGHYGDRELHARLQAQVKSLRIDPQRTPIVK
ncbi:MAG: hypothetical protein ACRECW_18585 [Phyllobacterium sp.]